MSIFSGSEPLKWQKISIFGWSLFSSCGIGPGRQRGETCALVAAGAASYVRWVVPRECPLSIMALKAIVAGARPVFEYLDICHLSRVRRTRNDIVAFITADPVMLSMGKDRFECVFRLKCPVIGRQLVAHAALSEFALGRVASVTVCMCLETGGYRLTGA